MSVRQQWTHDHEGPLALFLVGLPILALVFVATALTEHGDVTVVDVTPELSLAEQDERYGPDLWSRDPAACCRLRKVEPLARALSGYEAWATGEPAEPTDHLQWDGEPVDVRNLPDVRRVAEGH